MVFSLHSTGLGLAAGSAAEQGLDQACQRWLQKGSPRITLARLESQRGPAPVSSPVHSCCWMTAAITGSGPGRRLPWGTERPWDSSSAGVNCRGGSAEVSCVEVVWTGPASPHVPGMPMP